MMLPPTIVVLGVGNILMQDDGIGVWVIRYLLDRYSYPPHVFIVEGGVAGLQLLPHVEKADQLVIVDAMNGEGIPGTVYRRTWDYSRAGRTLSMSAHDFGVSDLLSTAHFLGRKPKVRILGIQPEVTDQMGLELSPPLRELFPGLVEAVLAELRELGVDFKIRENVDSVFSFSVTSEGSHA